MNYLNKTKFQGASKSSDIIPSSSSRVDLAKLTEQLLSHSASPYEEEIHRVQMKVDFLEQKLKFKKMIAIVEPKEKTRAFLTQLLRSVEHNNQIFQFANVLCLIEFYKLNFTLINLIYIDVVESSQTGLDFVTTIRAFEKEHNIPFVKIIGMISSDGTEEETSKFIEAGMTGVIIKSNIV